MIDDKTQVVQLKDFGDVTTVSGAQAAYNLAQAALKLLGGGIIVISSNTHKDFTVRTSLEDITVFDARDSRKGLVRLQLASQGETVSGSTEGYPEGSLLVLRSQQQPTHLLGVRVPQAILQRTIHGGSSLEIDLLDPDQDGVAVHGGKEYAHWYPNGIENIFVDQPFYVVDKSGKYQYMTVKSLGWDPQLRLPYFVTYDPPPPEDIPPGDINAFKGVIFNKTDLEALWVISEDHCGNQASAQTIQKNAYGEGDAKGLTIFVNHLGNIISSWGDEGSQGCTVEIRQEVQNFRGTVESFDPATGELRYGAGANTDRLATFRPIINMNSEKWIRGGKVRIYQSTTYPNKDLRIQGGVVQGVGTNWDPETVVGRYFALDDPSEYWAAGKYTVTGTPATNLYRWFRIMYCITDPKSGSQLLFVRIVGNGPGAVSPQLVNENNFYDPYSTKRELNYIIAPGANVADVSRGVNENDNNITQRTLVLQPNHDSNANPDFLFHQGDPIEQAVGSFTWNPSGFRVRHGNHFPTQDGLSDASFHGQNVGVVPVDCGLLIQGNGDLRIEEAEQQYPHVSNPVAYEAGIVFSAVMREGIGFRGDLLPPSNSTGFLGPDDTLKPDPQGTLRHDAGVAIRFDQSSGNKKVIAWSIRDWSDTIATFGFDPDTLSYYFRGGKALDVADASLNRVKGLSGSEDASDAPNNLRGINVPVGASSNSVPIQFPKAEKDAQYAIQVTPSWLTTVAVSRKQATGFDIQFGTPAPDNATVDWFLVR